MKHKIDITRDKRGLGHFGVKKLIKTAICAALESEGVNVPCLVSVLLTDNAGIHEINREQRDVDSPTDVLSFPLNELLPGKFDPESCEKDYDSGALILGDMVLSLERCQEQGEEYGHGFAREISYLTVHSVLHLLGYDHMDEGEDKKLMRSREKAIMEVLGR